MSKKGRNKMSKSLYATLAGLDLIKHNADGIDWENTLSGIQDVVSCEAAVAAEWDSKCEGALNLVFDTVPAGTCIPEPLAVNLAMKHLGVDGSINEMQEAVGYFTDYLARTITFQSKRGKGGGLFRV